MRVPHAVDQGGCRVLATRFVGPVTACLRVIDHNRPGYAATPDDGEVAVACEIGFVEAQCFSEADTRAPRPGRRGLVSDIVVDRAGSTGALARPSEKKGAVCTAASSEKRRSPCTPRDAGETPALPGGSLAAMDLREQLDAPWPPDAGEGARAPLARQAFAAPMIWPGLGFDVATREFTC
jgi:hypothetical protein